MNRIPVVGLLVAATASVVSSAFASGYGPAPFYRPDIGAPVSQRGQSSLTLATDRMTNGVTTATDVGGANPSASQSGGRVPSSVSFPRSGIRETSTTIPRLPAPSP